MFAEVAAASPGPKVAEKVDDGVYNYPHDTEFVGWLDDSGGELTLIEDEKDNV